MTGSKKFLSAILSVTIICTLNGFARAADADYKIVDTNEVPDILSMLASVTRANFEKIKKWQGHISHTTIETTRGKRAAESLSKFTEAEPNEAINEILRLYNKTIKFQIDAEKDHFFSISDSTEPFTYIEPQKGMSYSANWGPEELIFLATSEYEIKMIPLDTSKDNVVTNRLARKLQPGAFHMTDPRDVFHIGHKTLWLTLSHLSQHLKMPNIEKFGIVIKEKSVEEHIIYRIEISDPGAAHPSQIFVLSSEVGFNRTYIENWYDKDSLMSKTTTEFVNLQGVFLPKKWEMSQYYQDGGLMRQEINIIEHQKINIPIQESTFSEQTYLNDGDKFIDEIAKKQYTYKNNQFIEVVKKKSPSK